MDRERLATVEWPLKHGGRVKLHDLRSATPEIASNATTCDNVFFTDYLQLPAVDAQRPIRVQELDATGAAVTGCGLAQLRGCAAIQRIAVVSCART